LELAGVREGEISSSCWSVGAHCPPLTGAARRNVNFAMTNERRRRSPARPTGQAAVASTWTAAARRMSSARVPRDRGSARRRRFYGGPDADSRSITAAAGRAKLFTTLARTRRPPSGVY